MALNTSVNQEMQSDIEAIERNETLYEESNFIDRVEAIDFIEFHVICRIEWQPRNRSDVEGLAELKRRAESLANRLEETNEKLLRRLLASIRSGDYTRRDLRHLFNEYAERASERRSRDDVGYDGLDAFVNGLLRMDVAVAETKQREPDMVAYQPTPARIVLDLIERASVTSDDVLYDLGSGLGQVPILVGLLTGAKTRGIELEPAYCDYARKCARRLNLSDVEFINLDARDADYSDGTIFFMYTPFTGRLLQQVLDRLRHESRRRTIRICTYGPCTPHASSHSWLRRRDRSALDEYDLAILESV